MRGILPDREDVIVAMVPVGKDGAFDPVGVERVKMTYNLRFAMKELARAERHYKAKALEVGGVKDILDRLLDGTIDSLTLALYFMLERSHPTISEDEVWAIIEGGDFGHVEAAVYGVLGRGCPDRDEMEDADPKAPAAETAQPSQIY